VSLVNVLSLSDRLVDSIYSPQILTRFGNLDWVIACGDLPYYYLEYIISSLDVPVFFVRGNHDNAVEEDMGRGKGGGPRGVIDLHRRVVCQQGALLAGVEGSIRYRNGPFMYTQDEMWLHVISLMPQLLYNRLRHRRYLDVFVTHAPPWQIHDGPDLPHQGIRAFRWMLAVFQPAYHFHGHVHVYGPNPVTETQFGRTRVINAYCYRQTCLDLPCFSKKT